MERATLITSLLDGARDIRGAVVAGALWLFTLAAVVPIPEGSRIDAEALDRLDGISTAVGDIAVLAALGIGSYLIGSIYLGWIESLVLDQGRRYLTRPPSPWQKRLERNRWRHVFRPMTTTSHGRVYALATSLHNKARPTHPKARARPSQARCSSRCCSYTPAF